MARSDTAALATVIAVVGAVYAATLLPGITYWGEISKWQLLGRVLGIPHPTGYPLYLPLTHVVSLLSLGSLAWRINAFSLVCALVAVVALYRILRELDQPPWYAACFGMAFAFSRTLWSQAVIAEVYTLNAALVGWVVFYYLRWSRTRAKSDLLIASAIYALSFCHHLTVVCLLPAVVLLVVVTDPKAFIRLRVVVPVAAFIALGVSLYGYLFWRSSVGGPHLEYRVETLDDLWTYVSGAQYRGNMFSASPGDYFGKRLPAFVAVILREFQVVGLLAPVGLFVQRSARTGMFLGVALLGYTAFVSNYAISDAVPVNDVFFIPIYLLMLVAIASAVWHPWRRIESLTAFATPLRYAAAASLAVALLFSNYSRNDMSEHTDFQQRIVALLDHVDSNAVIMMDGWADDYGSFEGLLYFLLTDERYQERDIFVTAYRRPAQIAAYLEGRGPMPADMMARTAPPGLRVFTLSPRIAAECERAGLDLLPGQFRLREIVR